jgi:hypothetical protein
MFDMLQPGDQPAPDPDDTETFEEFEAFERLADIIQLTKQTTPLVPRDPKREARELDQVPPGVPLAVMVDQRNVDTLSGHEQVAVLRAHQRQTSHHQAQVYRAMAAIATTMEDEFDDETSQIHAATAETRAALRLTRRAAETELHMALELARRVPQVLDALEAGLIDNRRARAIVHGVTHLDDDTAHRVVDAVIDDAPRLTTGQLTARLRKLAITVDPHQAEKRYHHAVEQRAIRTQATEAGTTNLYATDLAPDQAARVMAHLNHAARTLRNQGDPRSMDQLRADVFIGLLQGTHTRCGGKPGGVNLTTDLETLTRLAEHPGELAGYGPVIADIARQITEHQHQSQWTYTITDPDTGMLIDAGTTRRRPNAAQRRWVKARDQVCVFPGCRMPAVDCDLDHIEPHTHDGPTSTENLAPACRHDHTTHTTLGWTYHRLPNGDYQWTTKLGWTQTTTGKPPPPTTNPPRTTPPPARQEPRRKQATRGGKDRRDRTGPDDPDEPQHNTNPDDTKPP